MTASAIGSAASASAVGPTGSAIPGVITTADVAMYPQYLGFSYRGGTVRLKGRNKKRKSIHEDALNLELNTILEDFSSKLFKNRDVQKIEDD